MLILLYAGRYDLIIGCFQQYHGIWAWIAGRIHRKPVIQMIVTSIDWNMKRFLCKKAIFAATACTVRGHRSEKHLLELGYTGSVAVIHNTIDNRIFLDKSKDDIKKKRYDLITVANYAEEKDFQWMLKVLSEYKKQTPAFKIAMCGRGLEKNLADMAEKMGIRQNIDFLGCLNASELSKVYHSSRVFILTSHTEGLPQSAIEALSYGLPCILTDVGDCSELIINGKEGFLIKHNDTDAYKEALCRVLGKEYSKYSDNALKRFNELKKLLSKEHIADNWRHLLDSINI
jgi:glycosyltransferase involved in cell wall biosynthesis